MENISKTSLFRGKECGTNSEAIYEKYAQIFGWEMAQKFQFGMRGQPLYARAATPEGYSVWCIAYSNLNAKKGGKWTNWIFDGNDADGDDRIEELWERKTYDYLHDFSETTTRVVFAKNRKGQYEFLGVYRPDLLPKEQNMAERFGVRGYLKTYRRISKRYPLKAD